jgi:hypothetical protein
LWILFNACFLKHLILGELMNRICHIRATLVPKNHYLRHIIQNFLKSETEVEHFYSISQWLHFQPLLNNLFRDFSSLNPQRSPHREGRVNAEKEDSKLSGRWCDPPPHLVYSLQAIRHHGMDRASSQCTVAKRKWVSVPALPGFSSFASQIEFETDIIEMCAYFSNAWFSNWQFTYESIL